MLWFISYSVLLMFSSKSFIVSDLTFRSLIHFDFIFVYGVRKCSNFILWHVVNHFFQHYLLKRLSFPHCIFLPPVSKIRGPYVLGLYIGFLSCSIDPYFLFLCVVLENVLISFFYMYLNITYWRDYFFLHCVFLPPFL